MPRPSRPFARILAPALLLAGAAAFSGCDMRGRVAAYRFEGASSPAGGPADGRGYPLLYEAALAGKAEGGRNARPYDSRAHARLRFQAATDSAAGRIEITLVADSIAFSGSDRDEAEGRYMEERLKRYKARMVLTPSGRVLALEEEPEPPPLDFSPLNIGRFLAFGMPAFPDAPVKAGSAWQVDQPALDKFHPASRVVKRYRAREVRETSGGRLLVCDVDMEAWLEEGPGTPGSADTTRPALSGKGESVFNLDRGMPVSTRLDLDGLFTSQVREGGLDSGSLVDQPIRLALRLDLRFGP